MNCCFCCWLICHGVFRIQINGQSTEILHDVNEGRAPGAFSSSFFFFLATTEESYGLFRVKF